MNQILDLGSWTYIELGAALAVAAVLALYALVRRKLLDKGDLASLSTLIVSCGAFFVPTPWGWIMLALALPLSLSAARGATLGNTDSLELFSRRARFVLGVLLLLIIGALLIYRIDNYSATLLVWEGGILNGIAQQVKDISATGEEFKRFFLWVDAPLSAGDRSLVFGLPALLIAKVWGISELNMRLPSAVYTLGAIVVFALFIRRFFGGSAALISVGVFGLNSVILIYGRYASAISGSVFAVVLAMFCCARLSQAVEFRMIIPAAGSLFLATLGYSPARVSVLLLIGCLAVCIFAARVALWRKVVVSLLFALVLAQIVGFEASEHRIHQYYGGRGEQFFSMLKTGRWGTPLESLATLQCQKTTPLEFGESVGVGIELIRKVTGPQFFNLINPFRIEAQTRYPFYDDPPSWGLYAPALLPFLLLGFFGVWRPGRRHVGLMCLALGLVGPLPLFLTNRVDTHRLLFLILPLSVWISVGLSDFANLLVKIRVWKVAIYCFMIVALGFGVFPRWYDMFDRNVTTPLEEVAITAAIDDIPGGIKIATQFAHQVAAKIRINLFNRWQQTSQSGDGLPEELVLGLRNSDLGGNLAAAKRVSKSLEQGDALIMAPGKVYQEAAAKLQEIGYVVRSNARNGFQFWVVSAPSTVIGPRAGEIVAAMVSQAVPAAVAHPPQLPHQGLSAALDASESAIHLGTLNPSFSEFGFAPLVKERSYSGALVQWGNSQFVSSIGTHARTVLVYSVPPNTLRFEAWIGISSATTACDKASAVVVFTDDEGTILHKTDILIAGQDPQFVSIKLNKVARLRIEIGDAGDGRDCDHVDFGDPSFIISQASNHPPGLTSDSPPPSPLPLDKGCPCDCTQMTLRPE